MITSIEQLLTTVRRDFRRWETTTFPWFRGEQTRTSKPLLPALFRGRHNENRLLQQFRMKAPALGLGRTPPRDHTDQWLFLAQHVGVPTRLLDWTEGLLVALFFALHQKDGTPRSSRDGATVWMLDPVALNQLSTNEQIEPNDFPLTWHSPEARAVRVGEAVEWLALVTSRRKMDKSAAFQKLRRSMGSNIGSANVRRAWGERDQGTEVPVAIHPTTVHPRVSAQKSCFTIHGKKEVSLSGLVRDRVLRGYVVDPRKADNIRADLRVAGISQSTIYPDMDGLAADLRSWF